jgi:hypothetical protein
VTHTCQNFSEFPEIDLESVTLLEKTYCAGQMCVILLLRNVYGCRARATKKTKQTKKLKPMKTAAPGMFFVLFKQAFNL